MTDMRLKKFIKAVSNLEEPLVSIVVPVYNMEIWLPGFVNACAQFRTLLPYELIFVDNNSTDGSREFLQGLGARVEIETRQGVNFARQRGLNVAKGTVVISMDADTAYPEHFLDDMALPLFESADCALVWATSVGCQDPFAPTVVDRMKLVVKKIMHLRLRGQMEQAKKVGACAMAFRKDSDVYYPADVQNIAGCDDGLVAIQLLRMGRAHRISTGLFTKRGAEERIDADSRWPKF
jgi:glycosyltransferase involved in cell wall biosynthesis